MQVVLIYITSTTALNCFKHTHKSVKEVVKVDIWQFLVPAVYSEFIRDENHSSSWKKKQLVKV